MAIEKYIIDKSDLTSLLRGEVLTIQPKGNIKGFSLDIAGNLTNGDVICALFPNIDIVSTFGGDICLKVDNSYLQCSESWWNSPYKAGSEDKKCQQNK